MARGPRAIPGRLKLSHYQMKPPSGLIIMSTETNPGANPPRLEQNTDQDTAHTSEYPTETQAKTQPFPSPQNAGTVKERCSAGAIAIPNPSCFDLNKFRL